MLKSIIFAAAIGGGLVFWLDSFAKAAGAW